MLVNVIQAWCNKQPEAVFKLDYESNELKGTSWSFNIGKFFLKHSWKEVFLFVCHKFSMISIKRLLFLHEAKVSVWVCICVCEHDDCV